MTFQFIQTGEQILNLCTRSLLNAVRNFAYLIGFNFVYDMMTVFDLIIVIVKISTYTIH